MNNFINYLINHQMKRIILGVAITTLCTTLSFAQCNVNKSSTSSGITFYSFRNENFLNPTLEFRKKDNVLQAASISMNITTNRENEPYTVGFTVRSISSTLNDLITPRIIWFNLENGDRISAEVQRTEEIKTLREGAASIVKQTGYFLLSAEEFKKLMNQSLTSSVLKDNRTGEQIAESKMYKDLIREQARCLISAIQD